MGTFTHYLTVLDEAAGKFKVRIAPGTPLGVIREALQKSTDLRYSPILPAYLTPDEEPNSPPPLPSSIAFFFAAQPYRALGKIKPILSQDEREQVFFTEGLASIVLINCDPNRASEIKTEIGCSCMELWGLNDGFLDATGVRVVQDDISNLDGLEFDFRVTGDAAVDIYVEQIASSIASLWASYGLHFPEERITLTRILKLAAELLEHHHQLVGADPTISNLRQRNSVISALVELSASLSYSVTQGTSGGSPILANRSPFPHHSLLGVGGAVRGLTKFTRYLERAFETRNAAEIIRRQYSTKAVPVPAKIATYESGEEYSFVLPEGTREEFDNGGSFAVTDDVPLLAHFSLRHGFKEAKFSVTAASESLTAECLPAWTLMTLSHEIMHSRVRHIFQALFGVTWEDDNAEEQWNDFFSKFASWYRNDKLPIPLDQGIRNVVLNFCCAIERETIVNTRRSDTDRQITRDDLLGYFRKHKRLAVELFVHFHDYYFAYAGQPHLYVMSLWASWITVAAPVARPAEYLVRTLATIASGTGSASRAAFDGAIEVLEGGLLALESLGIRSALFEELRLLFSGQDREKIFVLFKPAYYLIDQVRRNFASPIIASKIDRLDTDPFADGSTVAEEYSSSIYVYGDEDTGTAVSPIRYSLAALVRQLSEEPEIGDLQWLTAWNAMVISSQEVL